jgi:tripartite-type tricarboxylate transporter receptor subunit TctC
MAYGYGWVGAVAIVAAVGSLTSHAIAQEFSAKTVNLVVGFAPGGGYDTYARLLSRHLGRHLPGSPSVVVQHMPGGGSLNLVNATANTAPADGSHIGMINSAAALEPVLGNVQAKFETDKLLWIGNMNRDGVGCAGWHTSGLATWADVQKGGIKFGGVGAAGTSSQHAYFLKHVLKAPIDVITGYRGTNEINLAMQRGEVHVSCGLFVSSVRGPYREAYEKGDLRMLIQFGRRDEPHFKGAANVYALLQSEADKRLTDFIFGQAEISRPVVAPPMTPASILGTLRRAFDATMRDKEMIADAEKIQLDIQAMSGDETAQAFATFAKVPKEIAQRAREVMKP